MKDNRYNFYVPTRKERIELISITKEYAESIYISRKEKEKILGDYLFSLIGGTCFFLMLPKLYKLFF